MAHKKLESSDRSILNFRPQIDYVEPEFEGPMPAGRAPVGREISDITEGWDKLDRVAKATALLAQAVQIQIDNRVGDFYISLDPNQDRHVIDALRRRFPESDPSRISYDQYKECRENLAERGQEFAANAMPTLDAIKGVRKNPLNEEAAVGFDLASAEARAGLLRPDLISDNMPVQPLNMDDVQQSLLLSLMNKLWEEFLYPPLSLLPIIGQLLPESFGEEDSSNQPPEF